MRFCPFCAQENTDDASECAHCGRRLPQVASSKTSVPLLPTPTPVRPPPVRPLPRPRAVPTAKALPTKTNSSAATAPMVMPVASAPERSRSGTLLGVAAHAPARQAEPSGDIETRVDASPFDGPTMQNPRLEPDARAPAHQRFDDVSETTATAVRIPASAKSASTSDEDALTAVGHDLGRRTEGTTDVTHALPTAARRTTPALGVKASTTPPWGATRAPTPSLGQKSMSGGPSEPPAVPLPPPPGRQALVVRADPPETSTNPATRLPPIDTSNIELPSDDYMPRAGDTPPSAAPIDEQLVGADDGAVPPMPLPPGPKLVPAVQYLLPLARAVWARVQEQKLLRKKLHGDQRLLDDTLHELGRAAWQETARPSELREELARADEDDAQRREAEKELARLDMTKAAENERFSEDEHRRRGEISAHEVELARLTEDLAERKRAQKIEDKVFRDVEARFRDADKRATQLVAKAARAEVTPPEKGGGTNTAANFRQQAEAAQREADGWGPERDTAEARVRALDAPIAELERKLMEERAKLAAAQTELEAVRRAHKDTLTGLDAERARNVEIASVAEKGIRLRLVSTGTLLSLHRLDGPQHQEKFGPIYERLDELKQIASAREQRINQLESERHGFDRAALQRGLIALGSALGVFLILLVVVIVLVARK